MTREFIWHDDTKPNGDYPIDIRMTRANWLEQGLSEDSTCDVCEYPAVAHEWLQLDIDGIVQDCSRQHPKDGEIDT